jgi:hypothetical protein
VPAWRATRHPISEFQVANLQHFNFFGQKVANLKIKNGYGRKKASNIPEYGNYFYAN